MTNMSLTRKDRGNELTTAEATQGIFYTPRVDILENEDELVLFADLPGVKTSDLDVRFANGELVIHGRCKPRQENVHYLGYEYGVGDFYRAFTLSQEIDAENISAECQNGVLTVHLLKSEAVKPRRVQVRNA